MELRQIHLGPSLVFLGVFGGGLLWSILCGFRFDYLLTEVYHGDPGEAIWSLDPVFTMIAAIPGMILVSVGLVLSVTVRPACSDEVRPESDHLRLNLYRIGQVCLLFALVVSLITLLGMWSSTIEVVRVSMMMSGLILITGMVQMVSPVLATHIGVPDSLKLSKRIAILLAMEFLILSLLVLALRLYTWSFIRSTTSIVASSGYLGLLLQAPRFLNPELHEGREASL